MQITWRTWANPVRSLTAGTWLVLITFLTLCLGASPAHAGNPPARIVATGPAVQIGIMKFTPPGGSSTGGGWDPAQRPSVERLW